MKRLLRNPRYLLLLIALVSAFLLIILARNAKNGQLSLYAAQQAAAERLAQKCFDQIKVQKMALGLYNPSADGYANGWMLGDDFTEITTTLGSLEAKRISLNPQFAGLVVTWLHEAGICDGDTIGLVISGSFPALAISTLAAAQTMHVNVVLLSSLGASTFGANQPLATWADMESWLNTAGLLNYKSDIVTIGAENDDGDGLMEEGVKALREAARRNGLAPYLPANIDESIKTKTGYLLSRNIKLLINIGGNQAALGYCAHATNFPNGLVSSSITCDHAERGIMARLSEKHIPFINYLNIKELAVRYGLDADPGNKFRNNHPALHQSDGGKLLPALAVLLIIGLVFIYNKTLNKAR